MDLAKGELFSNLTKKKSLGYERGSTEIVSKVLDLYYDFEVREDFLLKTHLEKVNMFGVKDGKIWLILKEDRQICCLDAD